MLSAETRDALVRYYLEDLGRGDPSAAMTPKRPCSAVIRSNEECIVAGIEEASFLLERSGLRIKHLKKDGSRVHRGEKVLEVSGWNREILSLERVCLNLLGRMSGVATLCARARRVAKRETIAVTRKTVPGFQALDKKAAGLAGVWAHRKNLGEMILIKDNHLTFFTNSLEAAEKARKTGKKFEVEAENTEQALEVAAAKPAILMLDNFTPKSARNTIRMLRQSGFRGKIELSGGITLKNLGKYINLGADIISMGELTKKAKIVDFSLDITG